MNALDFLALALATGAVLDCWFYGSLFVNLQALLQVKAGGEMPPMQDDGAANEANEELPEEPLPLWLRFVDRVVPVWMARLLTCPFCLSYHVPTWLALFFIVPALFVSPPWDTICKMSLYCLAATYLISIANDLLPRKHEKT